MIFLSRFKSTGLVWLWLTVLLVIVDRWSKIWVTDHLYAFNPLEVTSFLNLTLAYNTGAAFSFLHSASGWQNWLFGILAAVVSVFIIVWLSRLPRVAWWQSSAMCLILSGAIGNAWDRITYGYVIDFIDFHIHDWHFAIFNIADSAICVGAFMLVFCWLPVSGKRE